MAYCSNCGNMLADGFYFCPECGEKIKKVDTQEQRFSSGMEAMKLCPKCGDKMPADMFYCLNCGAAFQDQTESFADIQDKVNHQFGTWKNKWVALILCIFFGWIGAHKFYEGKKGMCILYMLTLGLFGFGWIADIFILAFKPNPYRVKR